MRRKKRRVTVDEDFIDPEVTKIPTIDMDTLEIKGRGDKWFLYYPDPNNYQTPVPVYDKEGKLKETVNTWVATNKMLPVHGPDGHPEIFTTLAAAREAAQYIHPNANIKVTRTSKREEALAKAREAKRNKKEEVEDE
jgi:hypothetical protein